MQPLPRAYIACLRRELLALAASQDPAVRNGLSYCVDQIAAQLIVRDEAADALVEEFERAFEGVAESAGLDLPALRAGTATGRRAALLDAVERALDTLPVASASRRELELVASRADDRFRRRFAELSAQVMQQLQQETATAGWGLLPERIERALPQLQPHWRGARVARLTPVAGLHAKEIYFLDLDLATGERESVVVRSDRAVDLTRARVTDEYPLLRALHARGFAIPEPLAVVAETVNNGQAALFMRRVAGREKTVEALRHPRKTLSDAARFLARLHRTPIAGTGLDDDAAKDGVAAMWLRRIAAQFAWWREMAVEPAPVMWRARRWLEENVGLVADAATVVHGDFSLRNLLLDEDDGIASVLDWELCHVGHPAEDLGYLRETVESVMPWTEFDNLYRDSGGSVVSGAQIDYFDVWGLFRNLAINATVQNCFLHSTTTDYFLGAAAITYYPGLLTQLTEAIERAERCGDDRQP